MHDMKKIEENPSLYRENLTKRFMEIAPIDEVLELNNKRKELITLIESNRSKVKSLSKEIGQKKRNKEDAEKEMTEVAALKGDEKKNHDLLEDILHKRDDLLARIPNLSGDDVPVGEDEESNKILETVGTPRQFSFEAKDHVTLGEDLRQLDFETAARITGSRFVVYRKHLARLERALINFMIDQHVANDHIEAIPPAIVHERSLFGTGQLPKFHDDLFKIENRDWFLIPTAEVPLTNMKREQIFNESELPMKFVAYTPCFRSEAGSYGKDTRGLIRLHQFNKVELVYIVAPEESPKAHEEMLGRAKSILDLLELPYRSVVLSTGDMSFTAQKTIDLEVWLPAQNTYREISSVSNCGDFQARRAMMRFRRKDNSVVFPHTLNGSGLAVGRTLVAIMENYQNEDGTITIPQALVPYMGGLEVISK